MVRANSTHSPSLTSATRSAADSLPSSFKKSFKAKELSNSRAERTTAKGAVVYVIESRNKIEVRTLRMATEEVAAVDNDGDVDVVES